MKRSLRRALAAASLVAALSAPLRAHDGPPFPVLVDHAFAGRTLSIWADPDVGVGTFYLYVEPAEGAAEALLPLELHAVPENERWTPSSASARAVDDAPYPILAEIAFEARGSWTVRFVRPDTGEDFVLDIEVTPPGSFGPIDLLWFLFPFLAIGFLWWKGVMRQRAHDRSLQDNEQ